MEFDWIPRWWSVITTLVSLLAAIALLWLSKTFARREDLKKLESDMADTNVRVSELEAKVSAMPTRDELNALRLDMSEMRGDLKALSEALKPVNHVAQLLLEQRLNEK
jgi:predicted  nucleic acid-binding Zn-ribbon protein